MLRAVTAGACRGAGVHVSAATKPSVRAMSSEPIDYDSYLTRRSAARKPSAIRALQPLLGLPGMISLGGGMPNPATFPFTGFSMTLADGSTLTLSDDDVKTALQYGATPGNAELVSRLKAVQAVEHGRDDATFDLAVTQGSQDGLGKAFDMFLDADAAVLVENPTYSGSLAFLEPIGCKLVNVPTDAHGLVPAELASILDAWDEGRDGKRPKVLYTIPTGCNPTGASLSVERRRQVYDIARRHGLIIMEDDPYYYLQYSAKRLPSLFSMDEDGRVLRFDSFSKILSSGLRVGTVAGPEPLVNRINLHSQASNLHISGLSQMAVLALFRRWGVGEPGLGGLETHVTGVVEFYRKQCDAFLASADTHLKGLVEFAPPTAGMFVWMKLLGVDDALALVSQEAVKEKVLLVPGSSFIAGSPPSPYVRAAFSTASPEDIDTALQRLGRLLRNRVAA